jgi:uncharacterized protein YjbI with pentapeptide repeats
MIILVWHMLLCVVLISLIASLIMALDFSGKDLRGRSFKGQDLVGANFSYADIRGANFAGANLQDANFCQVKAGLRKRSTWVLVGLSWLAAGLSGFINSFVGLAIATLINTSRTEAYYQSYQVAGWISLVVLVVMLIVLLWRGISVAGTVAVAVAAAALAGVGVGAVAIVVFVAVVVAVIVVVVGAVAGAVALSFYGAVVVAGAVAVALSLTEASTEGLGLDLAGAILISLCSGFIGWRAIKGDEKYAPIRNLAVVVAAFRGTNFRNATLTNADFAAANLKNTDFHQAKLVGTRFHNVSNLDLARPGNSYLKSKQLRQLVVSGDAIDKNFDRQDLRGINLQGTHLAQASFIGADLSNANLQEADLSHAKLVQAQVDGTDFTGATLTGAVIQDWNITTTTNFEGVKCKYVYMREPTTKNPNPHLRKPDNNQEEFADGEFGDFIKPIFDTLDLYHSQGIDPRAIAISIKELAEKHPEAQLKIASMERRGEDGFMVRMQTAPEANKSDLSAEYRDSYEKYRGLSAQDLKSILTSKDGEIQRLANMLTTVLIQPRFLSNNNIQQVETMTNNPGSFSVGDNMSGNINNVQGDGNRTIQGNDNQAILGDRNQVDQSTTPDSNISQAEILNKLTQLIDSIHSADLPPDTKTEILEDLTAAKTATDKPKPNKPRALERLNSAASLIEKTSKTLEAGQKIWSVVKPLLLPIRLWLGA